MRPTLTRVKPNFDPEDLDDLIRDPDYVPGRDSPRRNTRRREQGLSRRTAVVPLPSVSRHRNTSAQR
jgi:hypothetical protein